MSRKIKDNVIPENYKKREVQMCPLCSGTNRVKLQVEQTCSCGRFNDVETEEFPIILHHCPLCGGVGLVVSITSYEPYKIPVSDEADIKLINESRKEQNNGV